MAKKKNDKYFPRPQLDPFEKVAETFFIVAPREKLFEDTVAAQGLVQKNEQERLEDIKKALRENQFYISDDGSKDEYRNIQDLAVYVRLKFDLKK